MAIIAYQGMVDFRRATAATWASENPILREGELGVELDGDKFKTGDGVNSWNDRPYSGIKGDVGDVNPLMITYAQTAKNQAEISTFQAAIASRKADDAANFMAIAKEKSEIAKVNAEYSITQAKSAMSSANSASTSVITTTEKAASASASEQIAISKSIISKDQADISISMATSASNSSYMANEKSLEATNQANISKSQATISTTKAAEAISAAVNVQAANLASATALSALAGTTSAAAQAANYRDQAIAASQVATAANETLAAMSQSLHFGNVVKLFPYFPFSDSDGGAWTDKCMDKSWENEALCPGTWRQQRTNLAATWAITGAVAGDYYQNTTDGKYYMIGGTVGAQTQTEVFRGGRRKFPRGGVAIVAEAGRVIIYETSVVGCPMWKVITGGSGKPLTLSAGTINAVVTSVIAINGKVIIGASGTYGGLTVIDFITDYALFRNSTTDGYNGKNIANINVGGANVITNVVAQIVNNTVNDIAVTVLDNAFVDPATGLKVPTIAAATAGGVSVIKDDGTVVNSAYTNLIYNVSISKGVLIYGALLNRQNGCITVPLQGIQSVFIGTVYSGNSVPFFGASMFSGTAGDKIAFWGSLGAVSEGMQYLKENPSNQTKGMSAKITNAYSTGWQVGDSRLATLADTVAETITASGELVTNGTFDTDVSGWSVDQGAIAWNNGLLRYTYGSLQYGSVGRQFPTVIGKTYSLGVDVATVGTGGVIYILAGSDVYGNNSLAQAVSANPPLVGKLQCTFVATALFTWVVVKPVSGTSNTGYFDFDNVSCKLVVPDRSVKNNGLIPNGTLTKAPVAVGANLVAYSGFSASNYLEQPYNPALDFGTGDFCYMGWAYLANSADPWAPWIDRAKSDGSDRFYFWKNSGSPNLVSSIGGVSTLNLSPGSWNLVAIYRRAGALFYSINGVEESKGVVATSLTSTSQQALLTIGSGWSHSHGGYASGMSLWRVSATAPSSDQIAHIYRTELPLFAPGAQCTIDGTSSAVVDMKFDDSIDLLQVATSWGRSSFKDLLRVESEVSSIGAITSIAASNGIVSIASATSARIYQPSLRMRDELRRQTEAARALGKIPIPVEFDTIAFSATTAVGSPSLTAVAATAGVAYVGMGITGTGIPAGTMIIGIAGATYTLSANATAAGTAVVMGQSSFLIPKGYKAWGVWAAEAKKREGATKTWTRSFDGFVETINFGVSPGANVWVSIMAIRSN